MTELLIEGQYKQKQVFLGLCIGGASQMTLVIKNLSANTGDIRDMGLIPVLGRSPGGGHGNPLQYSCLENSHGQRSLAGYSQQDCKELDMTEAI